MNTFDNISDRNTKSMTILRYRYALVGINFEKKQTHFVTLSQNSASKE